MLYPIKTHSTTPLTPMSTSHEKQIVEFANELGEVVAPLNPYGHPLDFHIVRHRDFESFFEGMGSHRVFHEIFTLTANSGGLLRHIATLDIKDRDFYEFPFLIKPNIKHAMDMAYDFNDRSVSLTYFGTLEKDGIRNIRFKTTISKSKYRKEFGIERIDETGIFLRKEADLTKIIPSEMLTKFF